VPRLRGLHIDSPFLVPDAGITAQAERFHLRAEVILEHFLQKNREFNFLSSFFLSPLFLSAF
jgi:hypothetical protein